MKFAEFREHDGNEPWHDVAVRLMEAVDVAVVAALFAEREGCTLDRAAEVVSRWASETSERLVLVAERRGRVEGYGKAEWLDPGSGGGDAPTGWYLTGLVVSPSARRHGLGARLTEERIAKLAPLTDLVWYFCNLRNQPTIELHRRHGFALHTCEFRVPGVVFDGGQGALFRLSLTGA